MQTFLPYESFTQTAKCLDYRRLGKQRVEAKQILQILTNETDKPGWRNHPAVLMWQGSAYWLATYGETICFEWISRGYKDTLQPYFLDKEYWLAGTEKYSKYPDWLGNEKFHRSHQSNLVRKDPEFYGPQFPGVPSDIDYWWPTKKEMNGIEV